MTSPKNSVPNTSTEATEFSLGDLLRGALECHAAGRLDMARDIYRQILAHQPDHPVVWHHLGLIAHAEGDQATAADHIRKAIAAKPDYVSALSNLAAVHRAAGDFLAARANAEQAIALDPTYPAAHSNLGNALEDQGDLESALAAYEEACRLDPHFVEAHVNAADILRKLKRHDEALTVCDAIVDKRPEAARPYFCAGNILRELLRSSEAMDAFRHAIALQPRFAEAHCNLGNLLLRQGAFEEAIVAYQESIAINPTIAQTHCNLGAAYELAFRLTDALESYKKAIELDPGLMSVEVQLVHQRRAACDWEGLEEAEASLIARVADCQMALPPFSFLSMDTTPATQQQVARLWAACMRRPHVFVHERPAEGTKKEKLKIGYLSSDFHRHATAHLMAELFELHDRTRFEIIGYSYGPTDCSEMRIRLGKAFDAFIELRDVDDRTAAQKIYDDGIDILIDLKGYTQSARSDIAANRPAPIQVNYIGYPGTMGCDFIDYVIADPITLPMDQQPFYDEKIVQLPYCYQPNDSQRRVADLTPSRRDCGLPDNGFVFCCFNNSFKLTPRFFSIWMRLLAAVPGSVLWLFDANSQVKDNLAKEAVKRGVDPERLVFAPRIAPAEHLARHRLADLFLDCLPYNAHTTTSDALWVGLPVVTRIGDTFAGRVAASLLNAIGLPELVTDSDDGYEALALQLATNPDRLADLRRKLQANRLTHPLFNTRRYARHLEAAFERMWEIWAKGETPQPFAVTPLPAEDKRGPNNATPVQIARELYAACPLCGGTEHSSFATGDGRQHPLHRDAFAPAIEWLACRACGHVHTDGYFAPGVLRPNDPPFGSAAEEGRSAAAPIIGRIAQIVSSGVWLEAHCGSGARLFAAAEWGYETVGLDPDDEKVAALRRLSFEAHCGDLQTLAGAGRFSVVSLGELLPRQPFPTEMLRAAHQLLRPGGIVYLSMPNREPILFNLLNAHAANPHFGEIDHYHLFGRSRLYRLLRDHGFEPVDYQISAAHKVGMDVIARKLKSD
ncbi:MAG: tetratricopeptide repeat protein [Methylovirgula sp.]